MQIAFSLLPENVPIITQTAQIWNHKNAFLQIVASGGHLTISQMLAQWTQPLEANGAQIFWYSCDRDRAWNSPVGWQWGQPGSLQREGLQAGSNDDSVCERFYTLFCSRYPLFFACRRTSAKYAPPNYSPHCSARRHSDTCCQWPFSPRHQSAQIDQLGDAVDLGPGTAGG